MKDVSSEVRDEVARQVQSLCRARGATFIIDDDVYLAKRINADGVHLGKNDMPIAEARAILGSGYIIGATVNSFEDVLCTLQSATPDYFGCGPFRYTSTKRNLSPILGLEGYRDIVGKMKEHNIDIPIIAIGGITQEDIVELLECGVGGIALSGGILNAEDPVQEMHEVAEIILTK
jgi:thiamine-phosphate pyrophosphorylase